MAAAGELREGRERRLGKAVGAGAGAAAGEEGLGSGGAVVAAAVGLRLL
jgi:hypothetical protein